MRTTWKDKGLIMKKVKKMRLGGIPSAATRSAANAVKSAAAAANKPIGMGEGIARAAGVPVGTTVNSPARIAPIGRPPAQKALTSAELAAGAAKELKPSGMANPMLQPISTARTAPAGIGNAVRSAGQNMAAQKIAQGIKVPTGMFKKAAGGKVSSASKRGDGIATKGKTKGKIC